jgi:Tfp pilus assembly protein FimT
MELLVVMACAGIALAASWPNVRGMTRMQRLTGSANQLVTHLRLAREKAVAEGNDYIVTFRINSNDYQVWDDEGSDAIMGLGDARRTHDMADGTSLMTAVFAGSNRVTFQPDGSANASGFVQVGNGEYLRQVNVLAATGKVTVTVP